MKTISILIRPGHPYQAVHVISHGYEGLVAKPGDGVGGDAVVHEKDILTPEWQAAIERYEPVQSTQAFHVPPLAFRLLPGRGQGTNQPRYRDGRGGQGP